MNYILSNPDVTVATIAGHIGQAQAVGSVLLLLSGGSNISLEVEVLKQLSSLDNLSVGLIDERYGAVGHPASNWQQLLSAGFKPEQVKSLPVLQGLDLSQTVTAYNQTLADAVQSHNNVIGVFGIGTDGHTSGILPNSPAVTSEQLVTSYKAADYERITTTPISMYLFDQAFLIAYGEQKYLALDNLSLELSIAEQPAQALKFAKHLTIYNDQIGPDGADL